MMNRWIPALGLFGMVLSCSQAPGPEPEGASGTHKISAPIVNGNAESGWSGVGALTVVLPGSGFQGSFCTGALISKQWVLTAAHCLVAVDGFEPSPQTTFFMVGTDATPKKDGPKKGTTHAVDGFVVHPAYDAEFAENDIALVHLAKPIDGVTTYLVNYEPLDAEGADVFYVGFGATEGVGKTGSGIKRSTTVPISGISAKVYASDFTGTGVCFGDSGGPGLLKIAGQWKVIGVNSGLSLGCEPGDPGCPADPCQGTAVSARTDVYKGFIGQTISGALPSCTVDPTMCFCDAACQADGTCDNEVCKTLDCAGLYECLQACDGGGCQASCYGQATDEAKNAFGVMTGCFDINCPNLEGQAFQDCVEVQCEGSIGLCLPAQTGGWVCQDVYNCALGCGDNGQCVYACYVKGTVAAQKAFDAMSDCFNTTCGGLTGNAFSVCAQKECKAEIETCLPPVYGTASCPDIQTCYGTCAQNDTDCYGDCYQSGDEAAQDAMSQLSWCVVDNCPNQTAPSYPACLQDHCGGQLDACFGGGETTGSETTGGETTGGETTGGGTTGGETTGGETAGGETAGGETAGGETAGGETAGGETSGGETTGTETGAGETGGGETTGASTSGEGTTTGATSGTGSTGTSGGSTIPVIPGEEDTGCTAAPGQRSPRPAAPLFIVSLALLALCVRRRS